MILLPILFTVLETPSNVNNVWSVKMIVVQAIPYVLLKNKAPYCFSTDHLIQPYTTYTIDFHAPDMIVIDEVYDGDSSNNNQKENLAYNNIIPPEHRQMNTDPGTPSAAMDAIQDHQQAIIDRGLDIRYQERLQKRFDILKRSVCHLFPRLVHVVLCWFTSNHLIFIKTTSKKRIWKMSSLQ